MPYLYRHIRLDTNKPFYIGIGSSTNYSRAHEKCRRNSHWTRIVNKTSYKIDIVLDDLTWEEACIKEKEFISLYGRLDNNTGYLCNHTDGGEGIYNPSDEIRKKKSQSMMGKNKGFSNGMTKLENRKKLSDSRKGRFMGIEHSRSVGVNCYNLNNEFIKKYDCLMDAQRETSVPNSNIVKVCKGERNHAGGYIWRYI
jgi:hypothetical protein